MKGISLKKSFVNEMTLNKAFEEFQNYNKAKNLSEYTISYYDDCIKYFRQFFWS